MAVATPSSLCARSNVEPWFVHRGGITSDAAPYWMSDVLDLLGADVEDWSRSCALRQIRVRAGNSIFSEGAVTRASASVCDSTAATKRREAWICMAPMRLNGAPVNLSFLAINL